jgi:hypothetical protein
MQEEEMPHTFAEMPRLDRGAISVGALADDDETKAYWFALPPAERFNAIELNRRMVYGEDRVAQRLQRFLEIVELARS